jgi:2-C-methyl-D-erythritol 2,4-cyclodiphosphate synthase
MFRIGFGYDVHQLTEGRTFKLGGIEILHHKGPMGHSDSDVLIHSICDALLGAANLRDIGFHFPDTSAEFKDIDSKVLLKKVIDLLLENNYSIGNIDCTVCLQQPKIKDFIPLMQEVLAETMHIAKDQISVKATTTETLGFVGREEGVSAYAVALIIKQ